jgi:hypothetical protein
MSHPSANGDWDRWSDQWRAGRIPETERARLLERTARARRAIVGMRLLSLAVTILALGAVGAALYHAANAFERALGCAVAIGICVAWIIDSVEQAGTHAYAEAPPDEYMALRRALCLRRVRFARLVWVLCGLDLIFLFPWWRGGVRYHGFGFHLVHVTSLWGPLGLIALAAIAAARIYARASAELTSFDHAEAHRGAD